MASTINADNGAISGSAGVKTTADSSGVLDLQTNGTTRLTIDTSGNLGLGVTPSAWDTAEFRPVEMGTIGNFVAGYVGSSVAYIGTNAYYNGGWKYARSSVEAAHIDIGGGAFRFKTAGTGTAGNAITWTQAMTLDASGNLIVGGTSAINSAAGRGNITINGSSNAILNFGVGGAEKSYIYYTGTDLEIYNTSNNAIKFGTNNTERARILANGQFNPGADNSYGFGGSGIRWAVIWAANGTIQTSDARQKNSIADSDLGLSFIEKLRPVSYKWNVGQNIVSKDENGNDVITPRPGVRTHYGLIAQEVKEALGNKDFGGFIHDDKTDEMGLRYDQFIAPLIKAIQEQQAMIDDLKAEVAALKAR